MGSEANLRQKTKKMPVQLYRTFFKVSVAAAIYTVFCILIGEGDIRNASVSVAISVLGAVAYEVVYFLYKSSSEEVKSKDENKELKQLKIILRFFGYLLGISLIIYSSKLLYGGNRFSIILILLGLALCQQMHNNKYIASHLSTFFESSVIASAVITLELMFYSLQLGTMHKYAWLLGVAGTVLSELLAQFFFHFYNCEKHGNKAAEKLIAKKGNKDKKTNCLNTNVDSEQLSEIKSKQIIKKEAGKQRLKFLLQKSLIIDRLTEFSRDIFLLIAIWAIFGILIVVGSVNLEMFDIAIAAIPVIFSVVTQTFDSQKHSESRIFDKYDPRITPSEFKDLLDEMFGEASFSAKALEYVSKTMTAKNGHKRYNGEDYYVHPIAVAMLILENTNENDEVIAAALLHDCIEDVEGCTKEFIEREYNLNIANYVDVLSKKKGVNYRDRQNMQEYLDNIIKFPKAAIIKIADRINNMNTLENCVKSEKMRKFRQTRMYYPQFVSKMEEIYPENAHFYEFAKKCFNEKKY